MKYLSGFLQQPINMLSGKLSAQYVYLFAVTVLPSPLRLYPKNIK
jgi:hypothetical protein